MAELESPWTAIMTDPVVRTVTTLDTIDDDLRAACRERQAAWQRLALKDSPTNRNAYEDACSLVDALLDMRSEMGSADVRRLPAAML